MKFFAQKFEDGYSIMTKKNILLNYSLTLSNTTWDDKKPPARAAKGHNLDSFCPISKIFSGALQI